MAPVTSIEKTTIFGSGSSVVASFITSLPVYKTSAFTSGFGSSLTPSSSVVVSSTTSLPVYNTSASRLFASSSPFPPITAAQKGDGAEQNDQTKITNIVVGVLVPVILIGIAALIFYTWYRKKYPVRMGIGRNFSTFSNPAYNNRQSTMILVGVEKEKMFNRLSMRNPPMADIAEDTESGQVNAGFNGGDEIPEDICKRTGEAECDSIGENVETKVEVEATPVETDPVPERSQKNIARDRPRRRATLIRAYDLERVDIEAGFEYASESDLGKRTASEISYGNESTDTHTISISCAETFDNRLKARSKSDFFVTRDSNADNSDEIEPKERSKSDTDGLFHVREMKHQQLAQMSALENERINGQLKTTSEEEFEALEMIVQESELTDFANDFNPVTEEQKYALRLDTDNSKLNDVENVIEPKADKEVPESGKSSFILKEKQIVDGTEIANITDEETTQNSSTTVNLEINNDINGTHNIDNTDSMDFNQEDDISNKDNSHSSSMEHLNPKQLKSAFPKRLSLTLSTEHLVLESEPQSVLIQDSIIFEPETPNPVHLDCTPSVSPRRGRRAFTLNDIGVEINYAADSSNKKPEKISKSSPQINTTSLIPNNSSFPKLTETQTSFDADTQDLSSSLQELHTASVERLCFDKIFQKKTNTDCNERQKSGNDVDVRTYSTDDANESTSDETETSSIESSNCNVDSRTEIVSETNVSVINLIEEVKNVRNEKEESDNTNIAETIPSSRLSEMSVEKSNLGDSDLTSTLSEIPVDKSNLGDTDLTTTLRETPFDRSNLGDTQLTSTLREIPVKGSNLEETTQMSTLSETFFDNSILEEIVQTSKLREMALEETTNKMAETKSKISAGDFNFDADDSAHESSSDRDDSSSSASSDEGSPSHHNMGVIETFGTDLGNNIKEQMAEVGERHSIESDLCKDSSHENMSSNDQDQTVLRNTEKSFNTLEDMSVEIADEQNDESNSEC